MRIAARLIPGSTRAEAWLSVLAHRAGLDMQKVPIRPWSSNLLHALHDDGVDPSFRFVYGNEHPPTGEPVTYGGDHQPLRTAPWILWSTGWLTLTPEAEGRADIEVPLLVHLPEDLDAMNVRPCFQMAASHDGNTSMPRVLGSTCESAGMAILHARIPLDGWRQVRFGLLVTRFTGEQTHPKAHLQVSPTPFLRALESAPSES